MRRRLHRRFRLLAKCCGLINLPAPLPNFQQNKNFACGEFRLFAARFCFECKKKIGVEMSANLRGAKIERLIEATKNDDRRCSEYADVLRPAACTPEHAEAHDAPRFGPLVRLLPSTMCKPAPSSVKTPPPSPSKCDRAETGVARARARVATIVVCRTARARLLVVVVAWPPSPKCASASAGRCDATRVVATIMNRRYVRTRVRGRACARVSEDWANRRPATCKASNCACFRAKAKCSGARASAMRFFEFVERRQAYLIAARARFALIEPVVASREFAPVDERMLPTKIF